MPVDWTEAHRASDGASRSTRLPAAAPDQRIGSLVVNYGGPGESGVDYLRRTYSRLPQTVRDRFDVVSFDPRGTGASRPIDCVDDAFLDQSATLAAVPTTTAQLDALHQYNAEFAAGCIQRMGAYAGQVGTRNVARDLEAIRIALGDPKLDYLGYSYGTVVGATYAQMFPATVGRLVLDGPPDYWISARDYVYRQGKGFMDALSGFLDWCQQTGCSLAASGEPARRAEPAHRARRPATDAGVVRERRRHPQRRADARACSRAACSRCSTTGRAGGRSSPTRSARR